MLSVPLSLRKGSNDHRRLLTHAHYHYLSFTYLTIALIVGVFVALIIV